MHWFRPRSNHQHEVGLGDQVRTSFGWVFSGGLIGRLASVLSGIVLARLLEPRDYGVFAVALVGLLFVLSLNDAGLAATVITWPGDLDRVAPTAATLILAFSLALYGILFAIAPAVAAGLGAPQATGVLRLLGLGVVIDAVFAVPTVMLTRNFRQDLRTAADLAGFGLGTGLTILLALLGYGAWSLAWGRVAGNLVTSALVAVWSPNLYLPGFAWAPARELLTFGAPVAGANLLTFGISNVDYLAAGRILGPTALGFYLIASNVSSWPANLILTAVRRVALAGFSQVRADPAALRRAFGRGLALLMAVALPACALMAVLAVPLITSLYGARWRPSAAPLAFLAPAVALRMAFELVEDLAVAVGRPAMVMWLRLAWACALVAGVSAGASLGGIRGVGIGYLAAGLAVAPAFAWAAAQAGIPLSEAGRLLVRPALAALLAGGAGAAVVWVLSGSYIQLAATGVIAAGICAVVLFPLRPALSRPAP